MRTCAIASMVIFVLGFSDVVWKLDAEQKKNDRQQAQIASIANAGLEASASALSAIHEGRRTLCAISSAITANPIVRIPSLETDAEFRRRVASLRLILRLSNGIDCEAVLAPIQKGALTIPGNPPAKPGGAANPLPPGASPPPTGGHSPPSNSKSPSAKRPSPAPGPTPVPFPPPPSFCDTHPVAPRCIIGSVRQGLDDLLRPR